MWSVLSKNKKELNLQLPHSTNAHAVYTVRTGNGQSPSLALGQEVIKQDQTPGSAQSPAI